MIKYKAYAKINLHLKVFPRDKSGYHKIETIFQSIDLADELAFFKADDLIFECSGFNVPRDADNLIIKAAQRLKDFSGYKKGAKIILKKNIPVQAGLGGGSADCARALIALNKLWKLNLRKSCLYSIAKSLGSDVTFNLRPGLAVGRGYGEILEYMNFTLKLYFLIVKPDFGIQTAWAYNAFDSKHSPSPWNKNLKEALKSLKNNDRESLKDLLKNDLERPVLLKYPKIKDIKEEMVKQGAEVSLLSGSGSAVFGIFVKKEDIFNASRIFKKKFKEVYICRPVYPK